jgi:glycosyltransferase involved in cell wall biosynthesis
VPLTLRYILAGQPSFLKNTYDISVVSSQGTDLEYVRQTEMVGAYAVNMARGISPFRDIVSIIEMVRVFRRFRPEIVHSFTPKAALVCAIAGFLCQVPVRIHTFTGLIFPTATGFKKFILKAVDALVCRLNTHIVAEGLGVKNALLEATDKRIDIIGNGNISGIDVEYFNPLNERLRTQAENLRSQLSLSTSFTFLFVGRINRDKGVNELVEAFEQLKSRANVKLLIAGDFEEENPISKSTRHTIETSPDIIHLGFVADVRIPMLAANAFVLPSYREGFPNTVLQACALARPCIVTQVPGSSEIIYDNTVGWVVEPGSAPALLAAMLVVCQQSDEYLQAIGNAARSNVVAKYERNAYQRCLLEYYQRTLS